MGETEETSVDSTHSIYASLFLINITMDRNKILLLSYDQCGSGTIADIIKQYFIERQNLTNVDLDDPATIPNNLHHLIGYDAPLGYGGLTLQQAFLDVISNDWYFLRYQYKSAAVIPPIDLITHIQNEDMTVGRITRNNTTDFVVSYLTAQLHLWPNDEGGKPVTQTRIDEINALAATMVIADHELNELGDHWKASNQIFDQIDAAGAINFVLDYDDIDFTKPKGVMNRFFNDPIAVVDAALLRNNNYLTASTLTTIVTNNNLANRIPIYF